MSNIIDWPESQVCIGCVHGLFIMSSEPSQYVCDLGNHGGSKCEDRINPRVTLNSAGYWWTCLQCEKVNEVEHDEYLRLGDQVQCSDCLEEFDYD